jgi:hypothetical protein
MTHAVSHSDYDMKCKSIVVTLLVLLSCVATSLLDWSCEESLPVHQFPKDPMSFTVALAEQMSIRVAPPEAQMVHLLLEAQNNYSDVFYDSVHITGSVRIWWKREAQRYTTLYISEANLTDPSLIQNGKMLLVPGQKFSMNLYWNMMSHDSLYLPYYMDYTFGTLKRVCNYRVICSDPETFVVEASLLVYDKIGYLAAPPVEFTFVGTLCRGCGGPYCTPAVGCGGG